MKENSIRKAVREGRAALGTGLKEFATRGVPHIIQSAGFDYCMRITFSRSGVKLAGHWKSIAVAERTLAQRTDSAQPSATAGESRKKPGSPLKSSARFRRR